MTALQISIQTRVVKVKTDSRKFSKPAQTRRDKTQTDATPRPPSHIQLHKQNRTRAKKSSRFEETGDTLNLSLLVISTSRRTGPGHDDDERCLFLQVAKSALPLAIKEQGPTTRKRFARQGSLQRTFVAVWCLSLRGIE